MAQTIFPIRLSRDDRRLFGQAARTEGKNLSQWLRDTAREKAAQIKKRPACLDYPDPVALVPEAERNPKAFLRAKRNALHR
jgi:hypothetical protein